MSTFTTMENIAPTKTVEQIKADKSEMEESIKSAIRKFVDLNPDVAIEFGFVGVKTGSLCSGTRINLAVVVDCEVKI